MLLSLLRVLDPLLEEKLADSTIRPRGDRLLLELSRLDKQPCKLVHPVLHPALLSHFTFLLLNKFNYPHLCVRFLVKKLFSLDSSLLFFAGYLLKPKALLLFSFLLKSFLFNFPGSFFLFPFLLLNLFSLPFLLLRFPLHLILSFSPLFLSLNLLGVLGCLLLSCQSILLGERLLELLALEKKDAIFYNLTPS